MFQVHRQVGWADYEVHRRTVWDTLMKISSRNPSDLEKSFPWWLTINIKQDIKFDVCLLTSKFAIITAVWKVLIKFILLHGNKDGIDISKFLYFWKESLVIDLPLLAIWTICSVLFYIRWNSLTCSKNLDPALILHSLVM